MSNVFQRVATAPISWGICEVPGWGLQLPVERVLSEMSQLGFTHTELGSAGWLPEDPDELRATLERHDMALLAAFVPLVVHDPAQAAQALAEAERVAGLLQALGARYFNTAPVTSADWAPRHPLTDDQWHHAYALLGRIEEVCAHHGLIQVLHEHVGCIVERADEVERILDNTSVRFVLDTGHLALGGYDPVEFAKIHADRVGLVHLKDLRLSVGDRLNRGEVSLMEAVQDGLFPALGQGDLALTEVIATLEGAGFSEWYVIEQDCALTDGEPPAGAGPIDDVRRSISFLIDDIDNFASGVA